MGALGDTGDLPTGDHRGDPETAGTTEAGPAVRNRAATVAALAAAIARVGPAGGTEQQPARPVRSARGGGRRGPGGTHAGRGEPPPEDPAGPGGDDPGDPDAVAKSICLRQLTSQARSRSELETTLRRRGISAEVALRVLDRLAEVGLVDDAAYAQAYVATKYRDRGLGRSALRTELRRKGIEGQAAERALTLVDEDAERRRAAELVAKRMDSALFAGLPAARRRLLGLLARRGYAASLATQVVNEALHGYVEPVTADPGDDTRDWEGGSA